MSQAVLLLRYGAIVFCRFWYLWAGDAAVFVSGNAYEHYSGRSISWHWYLGLTVACLVSACFVQGFTEWKKALPQLIIAECPMVQRFRANTIAVSCWLKVTNISTDTSVEDATTMLTKIEPAVEAFTCLPVPLHWKDDNEIPHKARMSLNPGETRGVDLASAKLGEAISIANIVPGPTLTLPTDQRFRLTIEVSGRNVAPATRQFDIWQDAAGLLDSRAV